VELEYFVTENETSFFETWTFRCQVRNGEVCRPLQVPLGRDCGSESESDTYSTDEDDPGFYDYDEYYQDEDHETYDFFWNND
jgi:hypothetical protein